MTQEGIPGAEAPLAQSAANAAGDALRGGREAAGLSIDAVARNLKLAPRQVRALEDGNFAELPGRTFVRGFARNYARLLGLDTDAVVAALPDALAAPTHDRGAIGVTTRGMGELPMTPPSRNVSWSRWLIPLLLIALIGAGAYYELTRREASLPPTPATPGTPRPVPLDPIGPPGTQGTPLPNPVAPQSALTAPATSPADAAPQATEASSPATTPITVAAPLAAAATVEPATLVITYQAAAWTEVRDANGQRLLAATGAAGTSETVSGTPPLDLTLGNAAQATVRWRGAPLDLGPFVKGNVARVRLP